MKERLKKIGLFFKNNTFIRNNLIIICYLFSAIIIELAGVAVTAGKIYIREPQICIGLLLLITFILFYIRSHTARFIVSSIFLAAQGIINLIFIVIYEMTGQIFEYSMLELRGDAMGILESIPINIGFFFVFGILISSFMIFMHRYAVHQSELSKLKKFYIHFPLILVLILTINIIAVKSEITHEDKYEEMLTGSNENSYVDQGILGNTVSQFASGWTKDKPVLGNKDEIASFLFNTDKIHTSNFKQNAQKKFNVITVLCESFEWFSMVESLDEISKSYVNGFHFTDGQEAAQALYPNLYRFYNEAQVMSNFYSKEKTDISENYSHLGVYPTDALNNYDFDSNAYPGSMANILKAIDPSITANCFHDGLNTFYNRNQYELQVGYDSFTSCEQMAKKEGFTDWQNNGERNLDSQMVKVCADEMFPTDTRFFTYIISITQHGQYMYRDSLEKLGYYDKLAEAGMPLSTGSSAEDEKYNTFIYYAACGMELDAMIGTMYDELEERGLLENTIITLFGDHNAYYQGVSNYVKNINDYSDDNYTSLYNVPLMIRVPGMEHQIISKFTTTSDIPMTIYDLLGINVYSNAFYGHSAFDAEESIMYSRAYGFFCNDKTLFTSLNTIKYLDKSVTASASDLTWSGITSRTKTLVEKIKYVDRIYYNDYYSINIPTSSPYYQIALNYNSNNPTYGDLYSYYFRSIN